MNENEQVLGTEVTQTENALNGAELAPETNDATPISEVMQQAEPEAEQTQTEAAQGQQKEPGWFKGRLDKELRKQEAAINAKWEAKLAPIYEEMNERKARELVKSGEFKNIERAREYVALKGGDVVLPEGGQPRTDKGQFAPKQPQAPTGKVDDVRANMLAHQAQQIKARTGVDVMESFKGADRDTQAKLLNGEWDFYDFAETLNVPAQKKAPPRTMATPNGQVGQVDIMNMSAEAFAKLNENLAGGRRYDMRK